jgi:hypothetical protein
MNKYIRTTVFLFMALAASLSAQSSLPIKATISVDKSRVYQNETIYFTLTIVANGVRFRQKLDLVDLPDKKNLDLYGEFESLPVRHAGKNGNIVDIYRYRCTARSATPGTISIAPTLRLTIMQRRRAFIGSIWQERDVRIQPPPISITTLPLPKPPQNFSGIVGSGIKFRAAIDPDDISLGDLITLSGRISGSAYTDGIIIPGIQASPAIKTYNPEKIKTSDGTFAFRQTLIPQSTNVTAIPKISLTYFDTAAATYRTLSAGPFPLKYHKLINTQITHYKPKDMPHKQTAAQTDQHKKNVRKIIKSIKSSRYRDAISKAAQAYLAPSKASLKTFKIPADSKIMIITNYKDWLKIDYNQQRGWIPASSIK